MLFGTIRERTSARVVQGARAARCQNNRASSL